MSCERNIHGSTGIAAMVKPLFETADHWDLEGMIPPGCFKSGF